MFGSASYVLPALLVAANIGAGAPGQKPLTVSDEQSSDYFSVRQQSVELCDAGSKFWTGSVQVSPEKSMFFCMAEFVPFLATTAAEQRLMGLRVF